MKLQVCDLLHQYSSLNGIDLSLSEYLNGGFPWINMQNGITPDISG